MFHHLFDLTLKFPGRLRRNRHFLALLCLVMVLAGCATSPSSLARNERPFNFQKDTFAYANELVWEYHFDEQGRWTSRPRRPKPDYTHHCFVVARSSRQFFDHARFDPAQPVADAATYRRLVRQVISTSPRRVLPDSQRVVIPGYANLHAFSQSWERLLKAECGGAWQSYFQRGHWRMIMPLSRHHQEKMARQLADDLKADRPPVVHLVRFPQLTINHAVVLFDANEDEKEIRFAVYDPNKPEKPAVLTYDRARRTFNFPANDYFPGGRVDVYEIYRGCLY
jgi:hypothetical protein